MTPTIEDVLKKQAEERYPDNHANSILGNNVKQMRRCFIEGANYAASLNRQGWTRVEDGLPTENDTSDYWYDEVMTLQVGRRRPTFMKYWEVKNCPFTKYWMPLPNKPSI